MNREGSEQKRQQGASEEGMEEKYPGTRQKVGKMNSKKSKRLWKKMSKEKGNHAWQKLERKSSRK